MKRTRQSRYTEPDVDMQSLDIDFMRFLKGDKRLERISSSGAPPTLHRSRPNIDLILTSDVEHYEKAPAAGIRQQSEIASTELPEPEASTDPALKDSAPQNPKRLLKSRVVYLALASALVISLIFAATRFQTLNRNLNAVITEFGLSSTGSLIPLRESRNAE